MNTKVAKLMSVESPFLTLSSLQGMFELSRKSARTTASRLVKNGILVRICRDLYTITGKKYSLFSLANALHQPSVISLETALNYWGVAVQVPQIIFSIALRSKRMTVDSTEFVYRRVAPHLLNFGQTKEEDFSIAEPEKALLDTLYMRSKGLAELLPEDVNTNNLDHGLIDFYVRLYPGTVKKRMCEFKECSYEAK